MSIQADEAFGAGFPCKSIREDTMTRNQVTALMIGVGIGLTGCDGASSRDMTAPDPGGVTGPANGAARARVFVRAGGETMSAQAVGADPTGHRSSRRPSTSAGAFAVTAATTVCDAGVIDPVDGSPEGGLDGGTYSDIEVPPGAICVLQGVEVTNSVTALAGSRLFIRGSQIGGNVDGLSASAVQVSGETTIAGDMTVLDADDTFFASCSVDDATIQGNLTCRGNNPGSPIIRAEQGPTVIGGTVTLADNVIPGGFVLLLLNASIGANAEVNDNGGAGFKSVAGNTVASKLQCRRNTPTFSGGPNTAGKVKGQCF